MRKVSQAPDQAKPNWWIFKQLAKRFGQEWASNSGQEIWDNEISHLTPSLVGIKYSRLEGDGLQWPVPNLDHPGTCTLHKDGCFTCGLGRFAAIDWTPPAEVPQGMVWMAFHFQEANANWLTNPVFDPVSQTAKYKACAVRLEKG